MQAVIGRVLRHEDLAFEVQPALTTLSKRDQLIGVHVFERGLLGEQLDRGQYLGPQLGEDGILERLAPAKAAALGPALCVSAEAVAAGALRRPGACHQGKDSPDPLSCRSG